MYITFGESNFRLFYRACIDILNCCKRRTSDKFADSHVTVFGRDPFLQQFKSLVLSPVFTFFPSQFIFLLIVFHASNSLIGSVTIIAGLYIMLWGKDKEMQNQQKLVPEIEGMKEQDIELTSHKIVGISTLEQA